MTYLNDLFALREHCEIRIIITPENTEIQAWTHPRISDSWQTMMAMARSTNTELAALNLLDELASPQATTATYPPGPCS